MDEQKSNQQREDKKQEEEQDAKVKPVVDMNAANLLEDKPKELPKLPKIKVVLGPNAHTMVVIPIDAISSKDDVKNTESETEVPSKPLTEFKRIMQRRKSMMPLSSKPLVDKQELFGGSSLDYEDLVDHKREQEKREREQSNVTEPAPEIHQRANKNLAVMFEKSTDNCSISTHNILAGKRRSRLNGLTLNETELYRNVFQLSQSRAKAAATSKNL